MKTIKNILMICLCVCVASAAFAARVAEIPTEESRAAHDKAVRIVSGLLSYQEDVSKVIPFFEDMPACADFSETILEKDYPAYCKDGSDFSDFSVTTVKQFTVSVKKNDGQIQTRYLPSVSPVVVFDAALEKVYDDWPKYYVKPGGKFNNAVPFQRRRDATLAFYKRFYSMTPVRKYVADCILERWFYSEKTDSINAYDTIAMAILMKQDESSKPLIYPKIHTYETLKYSDLTQVDFIPQYLDVIKARGNEIVTTDDCRPYRYIAHHIVHTMLSTPDSHLKAILNVLSKEAFWTTVWKFNKPDNIKEMRGDAEKLAERCNEMKGCKEYKKLAEKYGLLDVSDETILNNTMDILGNIPSMPRLH